MKNPIRWLIHAPHNEYYKKFHKRWFIAQMIILAFLFIPQIVFLIWFFITEEMPFQDNPIYKVYAAAFFYIIIPLLCTQWGFLYASHKRMKIGQARYKDALKQYDKALKQYDKALKKHEKG